MGRSRYILLRELLAQRLYALCCGYEDLNDHDDLRRDPLLAAAIGKRDVKDRSDADLTQEPEMIKAFRDWILEETAELRKGGQRREGDGA